MYTLDESDDHLIVAFEKSPIGTADKEDFITSRLYSNDTGEEIKYDIQPVKLEDLSKA